MKTFWKRTLAIATIAQYGIDNSLVSTGRAMTPLLAGASAAVFGVRSVFLVTAGIYAITSAVTYVVFL